MLKPGHKTTEFGVAAGAKLAQLALALLLFFCHDKKELQSLVAQVSGCVMAIGGIAATSRAYILSRTSVKVAHGDPK